MNFLVVFSAWLISSGYAVGIFSQLLALSQPSRAIYNGFFVSFAWFLPDVMPSKLASSRKSDAMIWRFSSRKVIEWGI